MSDAHARQVRRRRVFYIPGYDPFPPRRYRELYRKESAAQAVISGYDISLSGQSGGDTYGWQVKSLIDGKGVQSEIEILVWSDLVRDSMDGGPLQSYLAMFRTVWIYLGTGAFFRLMRLRKGPVIAALYPVVMLLGQLLLAYLAAALVITIGDALLIPPLGMVGNAISLGLAVLTFIGTLRLFKAWDGKLFAHYLMRDYAYTASGWGAYPPAVEGRIDRFKDDVLSALNSDVDEVLIVGHSSGAQIAVSLVAAVLRQTKERMFSPALSLLTLGQVIPMMSFLPRADRLRADLRDLSLSDRITWVDVSAPGDGCSFALCDPVAVSGVSPPQPRHPLVFSAAFTQSLSPARWKELRWRFFRLHFQYLCAFDRPKDYDYFQITAGPLTLGQRYAGRVASRSRIEKPVNKFTTVAA